MRLSQQIELIAEVKKEAQIKQGLKGERVEIGVSVYLGKDKQTGKINSQYYTCMTFDQSYGDLFLNRCPKDSVIKVIGDVQYRIGQNTETGQAVYGTVFVKHAEFLGVNERKAKSNYSYKTPATPLFNQSQPQNDVPDFRPTITDEDVPF